MINRLLWNNRHDLTEENKAFVAESTKGEARLIMIFMLVQALLTKMAAWLCAGYSGADVRALCTEAAMGPIRTCDDIRTMDADAVRPINLDDFTAALRGVSMLVAISTLMLSVY